MEQKPSNNDAHRWDVFEGFPEHKYSMRGKLGREEASLGREKQKFSLLR